MVSVSGYNPLDSPGTLRPGSSREYSHRHGESLGNGYGLLRSPLFCPTKLVQDRLSGTSWDNASYYHQCDFDKEENYHSDYKPCEIMRSEERRVGKECRSR